MGPKTWKRNIWQIIGKRMTKEPLEFGTSKWRHLMCSRVHFKVSIRVLDSTQNWTLYWIELAPLLYWTCILLSKEMHYISCYFIYCIIKFVVSKTLIRPHSSLLCDSPSHHSNMYKNVLLKETKGTFFRLLNRTVEKKDRKTVSSTQFDVLSIVRQLYTKLYTITNQHQITSW